MEFNINRGISTPLSITIVIIIGLLAVGGILAYEYYYIDTEEIEEPIVQESVVQEPKSSENGDSDKSFDLDVEIKTCQLLSDEAESQLCFHALMWVTDNKKVCDLISSKEFKGVCLAKAEKNLELCGQDEIEICRKIMEVDDIEDLFIFKNKEECQLLTEHKKEECFFMVALRDNDNSICEYMEDSNPKDFCIAITENNTEKCNEVGLTSEMVNRDFCSIIIENDINLCMSGTSDFMSVSECRTLFVFLNVFINKDITLCHSLLDDMEEIQHCLDSILVEFLNIR